MTTIAAGREQNYKSWYSRAFLIAIAGSSGFTCTPTGDQDFDGIDFTIRDGVAGLDVQLKSTDSPSCDKSGNYLISLDRRTYDLLSSARRGFPAYLVLVTVGPDRASWVTHSPGNTTLSREARWVRITGMSPTRNVSSLRVTVPKQNILTAASLQTLMADAAREVGLE